MVYKIINTIKNKCVNAVEWNGESQWTPPADCVAIQNDDIGIGDSVVKVDDVWQKS